MFWNRKGKTELKDAPSLRSLATQLGVERRLAVRVRYPERAQVCKLPLIFFEENLLTVANISVGGCCLLDPREHMGPAVGHEIELRLDWSTVVENVKARIVSRVDHRRHIQFLDLSPRRQNQLTKAMAFGVRAQSMVRHAHATEFGPSILASELWSSPHCDSLILENDVHRLAQIYIQNEQFLLYREAWPSKPRGGKCSRIEFEQIILFLVNIPAPSNHVKGLTKYLEELLQAGVE